MRHPLVVTFAVLLAALAAGCSSSGPATCDTAGGLPLADASQAAWPKFRHDNFNTGYTSVDLNGNTGVLRWQFPAAGDTPRGAFSSSPVLTKIDGVNTRLAIGSNDGYLYELDADTGQFVFSFTSFGVSSVTSTPAVDSGGNIFFGVNSSTLFVLYPEGGIDRSVGIGGSGASSPAIASDGTVMIGSLGSSSSGFLPAVCTNDIARWTFSGEPIEASPAIGPDGALSNGRIADCTVGDINAPHGLVFFASRSVSTPYLRAIDRCSGLVKWAFSASAPITASPVADVDNSTDPATVTAVYGADTAGRVFAVDAYGQQKWIFRTPGTGQPNNAAVIASPALAYANDGTGTLYVASTDGNLYAIDTASGMMRAVFTLASGASIESSPAVASDGDQTTIVFGADDGHVYRVVDQGDAFALSWTFPADGEVGSIGRSSPAIGADGTVYIGSQDGHVYAIGAPAS